MQLSLFRKARARIALLLCVLCLGTLAPVVSHAQEQTAPLPQVAIAGMTIYAIAAAPGLGAQPQRLISFDINAPGTLRSDTPLTGLLQAGEVIRGIDFRPATGQLYALSSASLVYLINPDNGVVTPVSTTPFTPTVSNTAFVGFDFNPVPDRIRVVSGPNQQNLRLNPNTGAVAATDTAVAYSTTDPNTGNLANLVGAAYTNNFAGATTTTNYAIDARASGASRLVTQGSLGGTPTSPNTGTLFTVGDLTLNGAPFRTNNLVGFDIAYDTGTAYVSLTPPEPFNSVSSLYTVNLTNGQLTLLGVIGGGLRVEGLSIAVPNRSVSSVQFSATTLSVSEGAGGFDVTVTRTGDTTTATSVDIIADNTNATTECSFNGGTATPRCDFNGGFGTVNFASGETTKTIRILLIDDAFVEGPETLRLTLGNAGLGSTIGSDANTLNVTITDNDTAPVTTNPIDDTTFFVRQQYLDFLNREPDAAGLAYWTGQITQCGNDRACQNRRRTDVSAAFFIEQEYQQRGAFIIRLYRAALGRRPTFMEFTRDWTQLMNTAGADNAARQTAFLNQFVTRDEYRLRFAMLSNSDFVNRLYQTANVTLTNAQRDQIIRNLDNNVVSRAQVLSNLVLDMQFATREYNAAFVLSEYFGYLRRDPDEAGFQFWLNVLNTTGNVRQMVCAFITSAEYQQRFGSAVTRTNADCSQ